MNQSEKVLSYAGAVRDPMADEMPPPLLVRCKW